MGYEAVIFDLDGTLVDTVDGIAFSMNTVLERHGFDAYDRHAYKRMIGNGLTDLVKKAVARYGLDDGSVSLLAAELRDVYSIHWDRGIRVYDGIGELLERLSRGGIPAAVNTNKDENVSRTIIGRLLPRAKFALIVGATATLPKKPDPAGALFIADTLRIPADRFVYLGDSDVDIKTATNAGMLPLGAAWGFRTPGELLGAGASGVLSEPLELTGVLGV